MFCMPRKQKMWFDLEKKGMKIKGVKMLTSKGAMDIANILGADDGGDRCVKTLELKIEIYKIKSTSSFLQPDHAPSCERRKQIIRPVDYKRRSHRLNYKVIN